MKKAQQDCGKYFSGARRTPVLLFLDEKGALLHFAMARRSGEKFGAVLAYAIVRF